MCAAKGHFDIQQVAVFFGAEAVGVMCAAKGHFDVLHCIAKVKKSVGVVSAAKGHFDAPVLVM